MSAQEIAAAVGTSDATVVRTAKRLGYANLRELRRALADAPKRPTLPLGSRPPSVTVPPPTTFWPPPSSATSKHSTRCCAASPLPTSTRRPACSPTPPTSGGAAPSAHVASYAAFLCRRLGTSSGTLTHSGTDHADELLSLRADHAVVVLAYGRVHPYVRVLLQHAADMGARVVLVTDSLGRRLSTPIAAQLNAGRGTPSLFATHGPTIVLLEALVLATAAAHPDRSDTALATLNDLRHSLAGKRLDVDPD